jgi:hypothetical protein
MKNSTKKSAVKSTVSSASLNAMMERKSLMSKIFILVMNIFRPVYKFETYTHDALLTYTRAITLALTGNLTFPTPSITLVAQGEANDAFAAAILAWGPEGNRGSKATHQALLDARAVVESNIRSLSGYVNGIANGDSGMILSAGMVPNQDTMPIGSLPAPAGLHEANIKGVTVSGDTRMRWKKVKGANSYEVYTSADTISPFVFLATTTKTLFIGSGAAGRLGYYQVRAIGAAGAGAFCTPIGMHSSF